MTKAKKEYVVAIFVMLIFVLNDLIFDFLLNFNGSDLISLCFTLLASFIVFWYTYKLKYKQVLDDYDNTTSFIKSNFDNWQVVFSVLDILCGIISVLSGLAMFACLFKTIKMGYVPIKFAVVVNKQKSLIKGVVKFSQGWTIVRLCTSKGESEMFKKIGNCIKNNKLTILYAVLGGALFGYVGYDFVLAYKLPLYANILISIACGLVAVVLLAILGGDTAKQAVLRVSANKLNEDNYKRVVDLITECENVQNVEKEKAIITAKLKKEANEKAQAELKAKQDAELRALTERKLAELEAEAEAKSENK